MSATGRKKHKTNTEQQERDPFDYYPTPKWTVHRFLEKAGHRLPKGTWVEPAAGNGAIIDAVKQFGNGFETIDWVAVEIQERFEEVLTQAAARVHINNFMKCRFSPKAEVCITNPPYKLAETMVKHAQTQAKVVVMLLRINFLASEVRRDWMAKNTPDIYVLPNRPSFRGKGSDATEYAWFVWDDQSHGRIFILDSTPKGIRQSEKRALRIK